ncbi:GNAT family N-acetyltransferase [Methanolobus sp. ZRKC3]|uniref:GNAT family N-acetyltransferase n=1 Tax=Methanolobus sp. ZRKC3 TaxID=3125786 RepID=UPI003248A6DB
MISGIRIRDASAEDALQIEALMSTYSLGIDGVSMDDFVVAEKEGRIIGAAAITTENFPEVHSIAVHPDHKAKGLGSALFEYLLARLGDVGAVYVRTTSPVFFEKLGFKELEASAKAELWGDCAKCNKLNRCRQSVLCLQRSD